MGRRKFIEYAPEKNLLLPPTLQDWLPKNHLGYGGKL